MSDAQKLLSVIDAARALAVSPRHLANLTQPRGPIPSVKLGSRRLYPADAIDRFIQAEIEKTRATCGEG